MLYYASGMWELFGLNIPDCWELEADDFFTLTESVDKYERENRSNGHT